MAKRGFPASFVNGVHGVDPRCSAGFSGVVVCAVAAVAIRVVATTAMRTRRGESRLANPKTSLEKERMGMTSG
jgi:hypothetical protein